MNFRRPKLPSLLFWLTVPAGLSALVLLVLRLLTGGSRAPASAEGAPSRLRWLLTAEGERRGFAILSDLVRDGPVWELWGPGHAMTPLSPIATLRPGSFFTDAGFGVNGGYWDERRQPVGVCAGERGIHGARAHAGGFALTATRAWIGPLTPHVRLTQMAGTNSKKTSKTLELALNPRPLPRRAPCLIDRAALTGEIKPEGAATVAWLEREAGAAEPLRFNTVTRLRVRQTFHHPAGEPLPAPPENMLELLLPDNLMTTETAQSAIILTTHNSQPTTHSAFRIPHFAFPIGARYTLALELEPVRGVVRLATCAGPRLLKGGKVAEGLGPDGADTRAERTWRTAVGCDATGQHLVLVMLARGRDGLPGATLRETARTLAELGATDALNLDGGSSSCVWYSQLRSELRPLFPLQSEIHHAIFLRKDPAR